ncbi:MAG: NAD(P)-binding protein [Pseudomonadota bacterium]
MENRVGIIGAGIAGAWLANQLNQSGHDVVVFEKSRGLGGRMATRRLDDIAFDHGAQFFTARTDAFKTVVKAHRDVVVDWQPKVVTLGDVTRPFKRDWFEPHYLCHPSMGELCRRLLKNISVESQFEVNRLEKIDSGWQAYNQDGKATKLSWVISTAPAEQTQRLLPAAPLDDVAYSPCFALMGYLESPPNFGAAVVKGRPVDWIAVSSTRPERKEKPGFVAHATPEWSLTNFEQDREVLTEQLTAAVSGLGLQLGSIAALHRWRYARVNVTHSESFWIDRTQQVAACGDWGVGPRVEDAFTSADQLFAELAGLGI